MAHVTADRVRDTSTSTGTGTIVVSGTAPTSFRTFSAVLSTNDTFYYAIQHQTASEWEVGLGTYSSANTITRTTVYASSAGGSAVTFSSGTKDVFITLAAARTVQLTNTGIIELPASSTVGGVAIVTTTGSQTLTNKTLTNPTINGFTGDTSVVNIGSGQFYKDTSGNVGIGTSSPGTKLDVVGSIRSSNGGNENYFLTDGTYRSSIQQNSTAIYFNSNDSSASHGSFYWRSSNALTTRMLLDTSGNLGIGASPIGAGLTVSASQASIYLQDTNGTTQTWRLLAKTGTTSQFRIYDNTVGADRLVIDSSGNVGIGVTPSAWGGSYKALQVSAGSLASYTTIASSFGQNYYDSGAGSYKYINSDYASRIRLQSGVISFEVVASGTAGNAITFNQAMTLDNSGNLGIGTASPSYKLDAFAGTTNSAVAQFTGNNSGRGLKLSTAQTTFADDTVVLDAQMSTYGTLAFKTGGTERMRIDSSGNVGIGTSGPTAKLEVTGNSFLNGNILTSSGSTIYNSSGDLYVRAGTSGKLYLGAGGTNSYLNIDTSGNVGIGTSSPTRKLSISGGDVELNGNTLYLDSGNAYLNSSSANLLFYTNANERARIDSSGNLLVGTTSLLTGSPRLNVSSTGSYTATLVQADNADRVSVRIQNGYATGAQSATMIQFVDAGGTERGTIKTTTTATAYNTSSDYRLKENVRPMTDGLATVSALKPVRYDWIVNQSAGEGFIAHELAEVVPLAVSGDKDAINEDGSIKPQGVDYSKIVVHLVAAIQELKAQNDELKARVAALETK